MCRRRFIVSLAASVLLLRCVVSVSFGLRVRLSCGGMLVVLACCWSVCVG